MFTKGICSDGWLRQWLHREVVASLISTSIHTSVSVTVYTSPTRSTAQCSLTAPSSIYSTYCFPFLPSPLRGCLFGFPPYLPLPSSLHLDRTPSLPLWLIFFSLPSLHSIYPLYSHLLNTATLQLRPH